MPKLSLIFPTRRPVQLAQCLANFVATSATYDTEIVVVADAPEIAKAVKPYADKIVKSKPLRAIDAWNFGAERAAGDWFFLGADDLRFHDGWLEALWPHLLPQNGVVGTDDGMTSLQRLGWATHFAVSRAFCVARLGGVMVPPVYRSYFPDAEVCAIAKTHKAFVYAPGALTEHMHPDWGKAPMDGVYGAARANIERDRLLYEERRQQGFPITWEPMIDA